MSHTCHSRVFSSVTRLLTLLESTTEEPHLHVAKPANRPFLIVSFSQATAILTEAITNAKKRLLYLSSALIPKISAVIYVLALSSERLRFMPFSLITHNRKHAFGSWFEANIACDV